MNILDAFIRFYALLINRKVVPALFLSLLRYVVRKAANIVLPIYLKHSSGKTVKSISYSEMNGTDGKQVIVSLTTFPARISKLWMVIECMMRQTVRPDRIILYLSKEQFADKSLLPQNLLAYEGRGLTIEIKDGDLRSHKKHYYALREFPDSLVFLIDDDIFYPSDTIEKVLAAHCKSPSAVICRYARKIAYTSDGEIRPYRFWRWVNNASSDNDLFFGSGGGTLFQPNRLYVDVSDKDLFQRLTPQADDIWLNAMTRLAKTSIVKIPFGLFLPIINDDDVRLASSNRDDGMNDKQCQSISAYYKRQIGVDPFSKRMM